MRRICGKASLGIEGFLDAAEQAIQSLDERHDLGRGRSDIQRGEVIRIAAFKLLRQAVQRP